MQILIMLRNIIPFSNFQITFIFIISNTVSLYLEKRINYYYFSFQNSSFNPVPIKFLSFPSIRNTIWYSSLKISFHLSNILSFLMPEISNDWRNTITKNEREFNYSNNLDTQADVLQSSNEFVRSFETKNGLIRSRAFSLS